MNRLMMRLSWVATLACAMNAAQAQLEPPQPKPVQPEVAKTIDLTRIDPRATAAKVTFLGAGTSAAPAAMRDQLKLPKGVGLVVTSVDAGSAAETAGLKQHDVIEKLNDQWLINAEQFSALLRSMKAGDEVTLSIIRQGERQAVKAKLGEKDIEAPAPAGTLDYLPAPIGGVAPGNGRPLRLQAWDAAGGVGVPMVAGRNLVVVRDVDGKQTTEWADDEVRISVERDGNKVTNMTMKDAKTGKTMFTGVAPVADDPFFQAKPELMDKVKKALDAADRQPMRMMMFAGGGMAGNGGGGGIGGMGGGNFVRAGGGMTRGKVTQWQDADHVLLMRLNGKQPSYLLALSKKDGRTVFDGPVTTDEERKSLPGEISEKFEMILTQPDTAKEFGVTGGR